MCPSYWSFDFVEQRIFPRAELFIALAISNSRRDLDGKLVAFERIDSVNLPLSKSPMQLHVSKAHLILDVELVSRMLAA